MQKNAIPFPAPNLIRLAVLGTFPFQRGRLAGRPEGAHLRGCMGAVHRAGEPGPYPLEWGSCNFGSCPIPFRRTRRDLYRRGGFQTRPCGISRRNRLRRVGAHLRVRPFPNAQGNLPPSQRKNPLSIWTNVIKLIFLTHTKKDSLLALRVGSFSYYKKD